MKKVTIFVLIIFALSFVLVADSKDDLQAIKKAVKDNPQYKAGEEVKWFKVLVTDEKTGKDKVRVTLPISVIEIIFRCAGEGDWKIDSGVDVRELFRELTKLGPMALIEVYDEGEIVKVWLE